MQQREAKFMVGQLVHHKLFDYRGVVVDIDPAYDGSEEWYQQMARSRPPKDRPWYRVLVHDAGYETYVAERNLEADASGEPINHPHLAEFFDGFQDGAYVTRHTVN